jgi:putative MATE family efflux protein
LGAGPFPELGFRGIAIGTLVGYVTGGLLAVAWLYHGHRELRLPRRWPAPDLRAFHRVLRVGVPGAANSLAVVVCHLWFVAIIGRLGDAAVAAHGVAIRCESLSWMSAEAFAVAAATLVGQSLGARRADLAAAYGWSTFRIGVVVMSLMGLLFWLRPHWLFWIFVSSSNSEILGLGVPVLRLVAFSAPALAAAIILSGALRGAGDTRWPFFYNSAGLLLVRIPLAYALTGGWMSLGLYGAWIAMVVDLYVRGGAAVLRFSSDAWTRIRV